jgi:hypothetical protein
MTALQNASWFLAELDKRHIQHDLLIVRPEALMVSVAVPGERLEIEFFDDGHVELERFESLGVDDHDFTPPEVLSYLDGRLDADPQE